MNQGQDEYIEPLAGASNINNNNNNISNIAPIKDQSNHQSDNRMSCNQGKQQKRVHGAGTKADLSGQLDDLLNLEDSNGPSSKPATDYASSESSAVVYRHISSTDSLHPQLDLKLNARFMLIQINNQVRELQTVIRDKTTSRGDFKFYADRLIRLVVEEGLNRLPIEKMSVKTPTGNIFEGIRYLKGNCGVSIVRSGESMEQGLRDCCRSIRIGKILIESDDHNQARVLYAKFPKDISERKILLLYPIMSTGLAVIESVKVLASYGVKQENVILLNLFSSPRAAKLIDRQFPNMFILTSDINSVSPNHFGHRYFGTD